MGTIFKLLKMILVISLFGLISCSDSTDSTKKTINENNSISKETVNDKIDSKEILAKIKITHEEQDIYNNKQKIVVWIQNNSKYILNGNLSVLIKSRDTKERMGSDMILVENLNPSQKTFAIIWIKPSNATIMNYEWSSVAFREDKTSASKMLNSPYKFLKEKLEDGNKLEFYLAKDKDFQKMYDFIISRKVNNGIFYHAVFVDNEKYAVFSQYPITAMTFEEEQSKHIIATYEFNSNNGFKEFISYDKNSWESSPKTFKK